MLLVRKRRLVLSVVPKKFVLKLVPAFPVVFQLVPDVVKKLPVATFTTSGRVGILQEMQELILVRIS